MICTGFSDTWIFILVLSLKDQYSTLYYATHTPCLEGELVEVDKSEALIEMVHVNLV